MVAYCVKEGKHLDAEEFLGLYLDALDEELVELHTYTSTQRPASPPSIEELKEKTQSAEGQTEVGKRDHTVRQFLSPLCTELDVVGIHE